MEPTTPRAPDAPAPPPIPRSDAALPLVLVALLSAWAISAADPDFALPDPFHPLALAVAIGYLVTHALRRSWVRTWLRIALALPIVAILVLEARGRFHTRRVFHVTRADDALLRYHYAPGARTNDPDPSAPATMNHLGLFDREYATPKPPGVYRVAVLSGSVANDVAVPFSSRFHQLVEDHLAASPPDERKVEVVNVSCEGYDTMQEVRLLETVGMTYEPDLVVVAHMLTGATFQDGSGRRFGNAFFAGALVPVASRVAHGSICPMVSPFYDGWSFQLVTRAGFERLALDAKVLGFDAAVVALPAMERFDDPTCARMYEQVVRTSEAAGLPAVSALAEFGGEDFVRFTKPNASWDFCHPNAEGHARYAAVIERVVREHMARRPRRPGDAPR